MEKENETLWEEVRRLEADSISLRQELDLLRSELSGRDEELSRCEENLGHADEKYRLLITEIGKLLSL
jgi:predicted nuclease with TOPRIM domain